MIILGHEDEQRSPPILHPAPALAHVLDSGVDIFQRVVHLGEEFDGESGTWFATVVRHLGPAPIDVYLNSPGGSVESMFAIHDIIRWHGNVRVFAYGEVASAAVLILACAHERRVSPSTFVMSHELRFEDEDMGRRADKDRRKWKDWVHAYWCELMGRYTKRDSTWWKSHDRGGEVYWLGGEAIVADGLADRVIPESSRYEAIAPQSDKGQPQDPRDSGAPRESD